ncbi:TcaA NTF2-like domain-containing protein [Bacillus cereus]|uniref:TcaA protein NTF2-like domain-containing protein n=1 Tax=Bacillus cereus MC67 TaxID=1053219 RepID=J8EWS7_BACCE|nr:hypothetical protein [Bacillus cereus]EJQ92935.1 hypothetical protein II3_05389 [Bacillus cereus MC67]EOP02190.1 hypothetical protein II1_04789 [Bacillus cereus MC118]
MSSEKKSGRAKALAGGIIFGGAALFGLLNDGTSFLERFFDKNPSKEAAQQQNEVTEKTRKFSDTEIKKFIKDYNFASVSALNHGKFAEVEDYLDPAGQMYEEQGDEIKENSNSITPITQKNQKTVIENIEEVSSNRYIVSTHEEYDIYKEGNKKTTDKYYHQYTLVVDESNKLKINKHIFGLKPY